MTTKTKFVFKIIWVVLAVALWTIGLVWFLNALNNNGDAFGMYFAWGGLCAIVTIRHFFTTLNSSTKSGRRRGANDYTVTDNGSHYTVQNHPFKGAVIGFIAGIIAGLVIGPIIVPILVIKSVIQIIRTAKELKAE